ncbi:lysoplasmalogenase [Jinshanibacter sp. LJY008]|uniref:Lysoplasmalogenase n=1 Tax=Limnobaculum eriocheiris TaxID=2897391 RepID=A0A9X1MXM2_9GAMM|nr:lysoplasmalogenase [Limnobaculum eriocheiris]MCD1126475.1 lysoplasmalogenase [Limnobaculum eriocheiris]
MSWPFLAVIFSGWIYIDAAYRGPVWQRWVFKPVTMLLMLLWAWQAPEITTLSYLILFGLLASLLSDILQMIQKDKMLYAIGALFISRLLYTLYFINPLTPSFYWPPIVMLLVVGMAMGLLLWNRLEDMRWPAVTYLFITLLMVWTSIEGYLTQTNDMSFSQLIGSLLLLIATTIWLINRYRTPFQAANAVIAVGYFLGHFMVVRALHI